VNEEKKLAAPTDGAAIRPLERRRRRTTEAAAE
jgi:hypothetical protein